MRLNWKCFSSSLFQFDSFTLMRFDSLGLDPILGSVPVVFVLLGCIPTGAICSRGGERGLFIKLNLYRSCSAG